MFLVGCVSVVSNVYQPYHRRILSDLGRKRAHQFYQRRPQTVLVKSQERSHEGSQTPGPAVRTSEQPQPTPLSGGDPKPDCVEEAEHETTPSPPPVSWLLGAGLVNARMQRQPARRQPSAGRRGCPDSAMLDVASVAVVRSCRSGMSKQLIFMATKACWKQRTKTMLFMVLLKCLSYMCYDKIGRALLFDESTPADGTWYTSNFEAQASTKALKLRAGLLAMALSVAKIFARDWVDVSLAIKLSQLSTGWQDEMLQWLAWQTSVSLRQVGNAAITSVSRKCPKLLSLDISGCQNMTATVVVDAVKRCSALKTLTAVDCPGLGRHVNGERGWAAIRNAKADMQINNRGDHVTVRVDGGGSELHFKVRDHAPLRKLMDAWFAREAFQESQVRFAFDGKHISPTETCASLGVEEGDVLDVLMKQADTGEWQKLAPRDHVRSVKKSSVRVCTRFRGSRLWFDIQEHTSLRKLMEAWCSRHALQESQVRFVSAGKHICPTDTCASLGLEEGCVLDVLMEQAETGESQNLAPQFRVTNLRQGSHVTVSTKFRGLELVFMIKENLSLRKLIKALCARCALQESQVCLVFNGKRICPTDTCASLGVEEGDVLDVLIEQTSDS